MSYLAAYRISPKLAYRVWQREVTLYKRIWPSTILSTLLDPVMYLLALGFGLGAYVSQGIEGHSYLEFIAPGLVASSVMYASAFEAAWNSYVRIFVERSYGGCRRRCCGGSCAPDIRRAARHRAAAAPSSSRS